MCSLGVILTLLFAFLLRHALKRREAQAAKAASDLHANAAYAFSVLAKAVTGGERGDKVPMQGLLLVHEVGTTVEFRGLSMRLKSTGEEILRDVNGKFLAGTMTAVLGASGSGKNNSVFLLSSTN